MRLAARVANLPQPQPSDIAPGSAPAVSQAGIAEALDRGETHYTDRPGIAPLRQSLAGMLARRFGLTAEAAQLVVTCGVTEARFIAIHQICARGECFATTDEAALGPVGALNGVSTTAADDPAAKLVHIRSSAGEGAIRAALEAASQTAMVLFEADDEESRFHPTALPGLGDRTVTIGDIGRPDWRIGYLAAPAALLPRLRDFKQALTICTTNLSQWAALAALEEAA